MTETNYDEEFDGLVRNYYDAANPRQQLAALEEVVKLADSAGDMHGGYSVRMEMIRCATFAGQKDKAIVAFTWCLAKLDEFPDEFDAYALLWKYKWILENMPTFVQVSKKKIYDLQDDMAKRLTTAGFNLRPIHFLRWCNAMRMGELDRANEYLKLWRETTRDDMADCEACEQNKVVELLGRLKKSVLAIESAAQLLDGSLTCAEIPHLTYGHLIASFVRLGRTKEIIEKQTHWYKLIKDNEEFLEPVSDHLLLVGASGQFPEAIAMFERHAPWAAETVSDHNRHLFYRSAAVLFQKLSATQPTIKLQMPSGFDCHRDDGTYQSSDLASWFSTQSRKLASQFDARNENSYYTELIAETDELAEKISSASG